MTSMLYFRQKILQVQFLNKHLLQGVISRLHCPLVNGNRISLKLTDGATVTYDLYHAIEEHPSGDDHDDHDDSF